MSSLNVELTPWQQTVFDSPARFKVVAAGRRCGKSRLAAWLLIIRALQTNKTNSHVFYIGPTQSQARDVMWGMIHELGHEIIKSSHINNLQITLINGAIISLKGADRPETLRGVSLKFCVLDEYAFMKPVVWDEIIRPALSDQKGDALFITTPAGRNHMYELYQYARLSEDEEWEAFHFTTYDNPFIDPKEIDNAKKQLSSFAFKQEYLASFEAQGSEIFQEDWVKFDDNEPEVGEYFISVDLAGFEDVSNAKGAKKKLDQTAISVVKVSEEGWWVADILYGRWDIKKTAEKIFNAVVKYEPTAVGIEKGALKNAVLPYISDLMKSRGRFFRIDELTHGNKKKVDRVVWGLQGRFENGLITLNKGEWNAEFMDQLFQFPNRLVHDDLVDSLAYIDQMAKVCYNYDYEDDDWELLDPIAGY